MASSLCFPFVHNTHKCKPRPNNQKKTNNNSKAFKTFIQEKHGDREKLDE